MQRAKLSEMPALPQTIQEAETLILSNNRFKYKFSSVYYLTITISTYTQLNNVFHYPIITGRLFLVRRISSKPGLRLLLLVRSFSSRWVYWDC